MRLVGVPVRRGDRRPVDPGPAVQPADHPLQPLHPREPLGRQPHLRAEPPAERPGQQPQIRRHFTHRHPAGQRPRGRDHHRVGSGAAGQLPEQDLLHHRQRLPGRSRLEQPVTHARAGPAPDLAQRDLLVPGRRQRQRHEAARRSQRERHGNVRAAPLELDHRGPAGRPGQHRAGDLADLTGVAVGPELIPVQVDPQAGPGPGQDLLDRGLRLLARLVGDRADQPAQRRARPADDDGHGRRCPFSPRPRPARPGRIEPGRISASRREDISRW